MSKEKRTAPGWLRVGRAVLLSGLLWAGGTALLAWGTVAGRVTEYGAFPLLCALTAAAGLLGALSAGRHPRFPLPLLAGAVFALLLGLCGAARFHAVGPRGSVLLLCALLGGILEGLAGGVGKRKPRRYAR